MNTPLKVLVRPPAPSFVNALTQQPNADRISIDKARRQHDAYVQALKTAGLEVIVLDPLDDFPDSVFIEDNAVILGSRALLCSMKPESRRGEPPHLAEALQKHMHVAKMEPPAFIDGGDVLQTESTVFVGQSNRTNTDALQTIRQYTSKSVVPVPIPALKGPHLKTSVSYLGKNVMILNAFRLDPVYFRDYQWVEIDESENYAANCLGVGDYVLLPAGYPDLEKRIQKHGFETIPLEMSEFKKADGGITCLSLLIPPSK